jgi:hypothetical protein
VTLFLSSKYIGSSTASPHHHLDKLYLAVLRQAFPDISEHQQMRLQKVLGTIVLLIDPLDPDSLDDLLQLERGTVHSTLHHLHSIAIVPATGNGTVWLIHLSFHDFLIDINRCDNAKFTVEARVQHTLVAEHCLRVLQLLSTDMCKIGDPIAQEPASQRSTKPDHNPYSGLHAICMSILGVSPLEW